MGISRKYFEIIKNNKLLSILMIRPFYFMRFAYYALKENSTWFYRYYPGYHGSTIPSLRYVLKNKDRIFSTHINSYDGIDLNNKSQESLLFDFAKLYKDFSPPETLTPGKLFFHKNPMFGFNDAFILYCFLRHFNPSLVTEIGSGFSSALMLDTSLEQSLKTKFIFVDPYSKTIEQVLSSKPEGNYELIRKEVQNIDLNTYSALQENDILFIDTSHAVKIGSDLSTLIFSILPSLKKGVIVHIHDIWYPWEYPENMVREGRSYNEIYFIRAFLQFNKNFEIIFYNSYIEKQYEDFIREKMPRYSKGSGASLWIRKTA